MKKHKVLSVFVIIGVVMLILGLLTTVVGFAAGGRIDSRYDWPGIFRDTRKEWVNYETEDIDYTIKSDVTSIDIDISVGDIKIIPNSQNARVEIRDYPKGVLSVYENQGTLTICDKREYNNTYSHLWEITIYLSGSDLDTANIETDFGSIGMDGITIGDIKLDLDAGDLNITNSIFNKLDCSVALGRADISDTTIGTLIAELDAGDFTFSGDIKKEADIKNSLGNVDIDLNGEESGYYFEYSISLGNVDINNKTSSGMGHNSTYGSSNAPVKIKIEVETGNIDIKTN